MGQEFKTHTFSAHSHDPTYRLWHLKNNLAFIFEAAGFLNPGALPQRCRDPRKPEISLPGVPLIRNHQIYTGEVVSSPKHPGKMQRKRPEPIESRDLVRTFKDFIWADNIRLERISICPLGLYKQIRRAGQDAQLAESFTVPLP